jgi:hypothetical protein
MGTFPDGFCIRRGLHWLIPLCWSAALIARAGDGVTAGGPVNDRCADAVPIVDGTTAFNTTGADTDGLPEPTCPFLPSDRQINQDIWFTYTSSCTGVLTVSLCDTAAPPAGYDTKVAVYLGTHCPPLANPLACNDDGCPPIGASLTSIVNIRVNRGQRYTLRIGGYLIGEGAGTVEISCLPDEPSCFANEGDCCEAHATQGCSDPDCCERICSMDEACCDGVWSASCASSAQRACGVCGGGDGEECIGCIPIHSGETYTGSTIGAAGMNLGLCEEQTSASNPDLWHCWRADCTGEATIRLCGSDFDTTLGVFEACGGRQITCNDDGCPAPNTTHSRAQFRATAGTLYYIRVAGFRGDSGNYSLHAVCEVGPPNDRCAAALPLMAGTTFFDTQTATSDGTTLPAQCNDGSGVFLGSDIWYDFTAPCTGITTISTCNRADFDTRLAVYRGCDCPADNARLVDCSNDAGTCALGTSELSFSVTAGQCYKVRVGGFASFAMSESGTGSLRVSCDPPAPNDRCQNAPIENLPHTYDGNNLVAANDCAGLPGPQVWLGFRLTQTSDVRLEYCGSSPPFDAVWRELVQGCPCRSFSRAGAGCFLCDDTNAELLWNCLPAGEYYYPVVSEPGSEGSYSIHVQADPCRTNNHCSDAFAVTDGETLFSTELASTDGPLLPASCNEGPGLSFGQDVWFRYTASCTGSAVFSSCNSVDYDSRMALYSGSACPVANDRLVGCNDDHPSCGGASSRLEADVEEGAAYLFRLGGYSTAIGTGCFHVECVPECPEESVTYLNPMPDVVDARQPTTLQGGPLLGIREVRVAAAEVVQRACMEICETSHVKLPENFVQDLMHHGDGTATVILARPMSPGAVTTIRYQADDSHGAFIVHPGNANGDEAANALDARSFLDYLDGHPMNPPPWALFSTDLDHSGALNPQDLARLMDLLLGADDLTPWDGTTRPDGTGVCP